MDSYVEPDSERSLLLTIDVQNDFTLPGGSATIEGTRECLPRMKRLVERFRELSKPIVHVVRLYLADGSNVDPCRRGDIESGAEVVRPGTEGAELVEELKPDSELRMDSDTLLDGEFQAAGEREWIMYKPRWGAFYDTPLESRLNEMSINTLVVCGCNFPNCPRTTVYEASERDYRVVLVPEATSGTYERGLKELDGIGVSLMDTDAVIDWLE